MFACLLVCFSLVNLCLVNLCLVCLSACPLSARLLVCLSADFAKLLQNIHIRARFPLFLFLPSAILMKTVTFQPVFNYIFSYNVSVPCRLVTKRPAFDCNLIWHLLSPKTCPFAPPFVPFCMAVWCFFTWQKGGSSSLKIILFNAQICY